MTESELEAFDPEIASAGARAAAVERFRTTPSGRDKPSRYWREDIEGIDLEAPGPRAGAAAVTWSKVPARAIACDLRTAFREHRDLVTRAFGRAVTPAHKWSHLGVAYAQDGAFVYVPAEAAGSEPLALDIRVDGTGSAFAYVVVLAERGSSIDIVERLYAPAARFANVTVEIVACEGARVQYSSVQQAGDATSVYATRAAAPGKDAFVAINSAELGAHLSVSDISIGMNATGVTADVSALFFPSGTQHVDMVSTADHAVGETTSSTLVKSAAIGSGQARYLGNIRIAPHAQGSNAALRDDALLLSKRAHIDSIPALEIAANDVKAYHGATVGAIDEEALFYMTSRGIEPAAAERMIALGFFEPVIERFPGEALRDELRAALAAKVEAAP